MTQGMKPATIPGARTRNVIVPIHARALEADVATSTRLAPTNPESSRRPDRSRRPSGRRRVVLSERAEDGGRLSVQLELVEQRFQFAFLEPEVRFHDRGETLQMARKQPG